MKFYLCDTEVGPQFVHLQADAKKIDKDFVVEEVDVAKEPLMNRLNDLMRRAFFTESGTVMAEEEVDVAVSSPPPQQKSQSRYATMPEYAVRNEFQGAWEQFLWDIPAKEAYRLDVLQKIIDERRREINEGKNV